MTRLRAYQLLSALTVVLCFLVGAVLLSGFVSNTLLPAAMQRGPTPLETNYWGFYMMGFAGVLLMTWGACLLYAVRTPALARAVGTATAFGLSLNAIFRILAWFSGEYAEVGNLPRIEAAIMLLLALGFVWLRPQPADIARSSAKRRGVMRAAGRWVATAACLALLLVVGTLDRNFHGSAEVRSDVPAAVGEIGGRLPDFTLPDITGRAVSLSQFHGRSRVLLTFERSLDW
ncbi:MAG: peroxiredoxin family protein [Candidatus Binatia bacterium]